MDQTNDSELTEEQYAYQHVLREEQAGAVIRILDSDVTSNEILRVAEDTAQFASSTRDEIADPASPKLACKKKCHWCCHQTVGAFPPEIFLLAEHVNTNFTAKEKNQLITKLEALDHQTRGKTASQRAKVNMPCAFLSFGKCSVYPVRPLACSRQTSYDVEACKKAKPKGFPLGSIRSERAQEMAYNGAVWGMVDGLIEKLPDAEMEELELTPAILAVLKENITATMWSNGAYRFEGCQLVCDQ